MRIYANFDKSSHKHHGVQVVTTEIYVNNVEHEQSHEMLNVYTHTQACIKMICNQLTRKNLSLGWMIHMPRKSLGYLTPLEYFKKLYNFGFGSRCTSI